MSSEVETESEDSGEYSSIPLAEVAEVSRSSPVARCQGWTKLAPEMLKAQDILRLSWLFWNSTFRVADWDGGSHLYESGPDGVLQLPGYYNAQAAFHPCGLAGRGIGVCPTYLHMFCRLQEGLRLDPKGSTVGDIGEYRAPGSLLQAIQSLYDQSKSCVCMLGTKKSLFPVTVGPRRVVSCL